MEVPVLPHNFGLKYKQNYDFKYGIQNIALRRTLISKPLTNYGWAHKLYNVWSLSSRVRTELCDFHIRVTSDKSPISESPKEEIQQRLSFV